MKKTYRIVFALAAFATALTGCVKEGDSVSPEKTITFTAAPVETRTAFGAKEGNKYPTLWTAEDTNVKIIQNMTTNKNAAVTPSADFKTATFSAEFSTSGDNNFYCVSPASAWMTSSTTNERVLIVVPPVQTPTATSVDPAAQILVAKTPCGSGELPSSISFDLGHFTAYGKLSLSNLALNETNGTTIKRVDLTTEDQAWSGRWKYYFNGDAPESDASFKTISINTSSSSDIWFACAPADMSGKTLTVTVRTDKGTLSKTFTMPGSCSFSSGHVKPISVNMNEAVFTAKKVYKRITSMGGFVADSRVLLVSTKRPYAMSTTSYNSDKRLGTAVEIEGDEIIDPSVEVEVVRVLNSLGATYENGRFSVYRLYLPRLSKALGASNVNNAFSVNSNSKYEKYHWCVTMDGDGVTTIETVVDQTDDTIQATYSNGVDIFGVYSPTSARGYMHIYKLQ